MMKERGEQGSSRSALREFLASEAAGGILLMAAAALAMLVANSALSSESAVSTILSDRDFIRRANSRKKDSPFGEILPSKLRSCLSGSRS